MSNMAPAHSSNLISIRRHLAARRRDAISVGEIFCEQGHTTSVCQQVNMTVGGTSIVGN